MTISIDDICADSLSHEIKKARAGNDRESGMHALRNVREALRSLLEPNDNQMNKTNRIAIEYAAQCISDFFSSNGQDLNAAFGVTRPRGQPSKTFARSYIERTTAQYLVEEILETDKRGITHARKRAAQRLGISYQKVVALTSSALKPAP